MERERWQRLKQVFQAAEDLPPEARSQYLDEACAGDHELRGEVDSLLASQEQAQTFLSRRAADYLPGVWNETGRRIGHYEIVRELGSGGMGSVYLAVRTDAYRQQVALKLLRRGMNSDFILSRFHNERQILASLDHPNIARLLDGGATGDERPYFVMELVEGAPIDRYCEERALPIVDRLKLFRLVCSAVHYAHQNLVIHRDLKPGNILVTADGVPKLLDFGIAKILNPELAAQTIALTSAEMRLMTPEYASPEQVRGQPITTGSDVYSLGVILYELLTGEKPYSLQGRSLAEVERIVCEEEPKPPSAGRAEKLRRQLKGELDNIVLKALQKEPQRRYISVERFSDDIRRHLEGLPVAAQSDTIGYRAAKFVKRNRAGVAAAALIFLALLGGIVTTTWQAHIARTERSRAERRFNDVRKLANSFLFEFHDSIKNLPGSTPARQLVVKKALEYLDSLSREARGDSSLQQELAQAYVQVGTLQGNPNSANLGDIAGALKSYEQALRIRQELAAAEPGNAQARADLASAYNNIGQLQMAMGRTADALASFRASLDISEKLADAGQAASGYARLGDIQMTMGDTSAALDSYRKSLSLYQQVAAGNPRNREAQSEVSSAFDRIGALQLARGDTQGAIENNRKALAFAEELASRDPNHAKARRGLAMAHYRMGDMQETVGQSQAALESYQRALAIIQPLAATDPKNVQMRRDVGAIQSRLGDAQSSLGRLAEALDSYQKSLAIGLELAAADPRNTRARKDLSSSYSSVGVAQERLGKISEALKNHRASLRIRQDLVDADSKDAEARRELSVSLNRVGNALAELGEMPRAIETTRKALAIAVNLAKSDPGNTQMQSDLSFTYTQLAKIESKAGATAEAIANFRKALEIDQRLAAADPQNWQGQSEVASDWDLIAQNQMKLGRRSEAIESYRRALKIYEAVAAGNPNSAQFQGELAASLMDAASLLDDQGEARRMLERRALEHATRAVRMTKESVPGLLDIQASALFANGDARRAIAAEKQALALLPPQPEARKSYLDRLRKYQAAAPGPQ